MLTEIAGPGEGLLPLIRQAVAVICAESLSGGADPQQVRQFMNTAVALSRAADQILHLRNGIVHAHRPAQSAGPGAAKSDSHYRGATLGNLADEYGTDVEIYRKALSPTIYAVTRKAAPETLLDLLDRLGLERHEIRTAGPVYTWHEVPENLDSAGQQRLASRAIPALLLAGYTVNCTPEVFDEAAYQQAVRDLSSSVSRQTTHAPKPAAPARTRTSPRRAP
ncbi:hypothetical protein AB0E62_35550 [Streptomyces sp. NPDC038707]|uniref:hypothetical protein n=1 Tax=Streptomyces sp. NPDC038707 TaxID=3154329 RepID=UPI0033F98A13